MPDQKAQGLGDTTEQIFKTFGIDKVAKSIFGEDCGCGKRKEDLNTMFDYNKKDRCMTQEQASAFEAFQNRKDKLNLTGDQVDVLTNLYNTIFKANVKPCRGCSAKMLKSRIDRVQSVYEKYVTLQEQSKNVKTQTDGKKEISTESGSGKNSGSTTKKPTGTKAKSKKATGKKRSTPRTKKVQRK